MVGVTVQSGAPGLPGHAMMAPVGGGAAGGSAGSSVVIETAPTISPTYRAPLDLANKGSGPLTVVTSGSMPTGAYRAHAPKMKGYIKLAISN